DDIVHSFSGVRPLYDDNADNPSAVTRDYISELDGRGGAPPLLSVFGGKITTVRKLAAHALEKLRPHLAGVGAAWTPGASLPGGDIPDADFERFLAGLESNHAWLPEPLARHYGRLYGTRTARVIGSARSVPDLGACFGENFYECEARYLASEEWAMTPEDVLDRRTKHGLHMTQAERTAFEAWWAGELAQAG